MQASGPRTLRDEVGLKIDELAADSELHGSITSYFDLLQRLHGPPRAVTLSYTPAAIRPTPDQHPQPQPFDDAQFLKGTNRLK